jgi:hypothetical protein
MSLCVLVSPFAIPRLQEQLLDVLRALSSPNLDIRRKTLDIALDLITSRNIDEVGVVLPVAIFPLQLTCDLRVAWL